jgi:hypothetical protein
MTAYLFLQKFEAGRVVGMPYLEVIATLSKYGKAGRGLGDMEIYFPENKFAEVCTIAGSEESELHCLNAQPSTKTVWGAWQSIAALYLTVRHGTPPWNSCPMVWQLFSMRDRYAPCNSYGLRYPNSQRSLMEHSRLRYTNRNPNAIIQLFDSCRKVSLLP